MNSNSVRVVDNPVNYRIGQWVYFVNQNSSKIANKFPVFSKGISLKKRGTLPIIYQIIYPFLSRNIIAKYFNILANTFCLWSNTDSFLTHQCVLNSVTPAFKDKQVSVVDYSVNHCGCHLAVCINIAPFGKF